MSNYSFSIGYWQRPRQNTFVKSRSPGAAVFGHHVTDPGGHVPRILMNVNEVAFVLSIARDRHVLYRHVLLNCRGEIGWTYEENLIEIDV